MLQEGDEIDIWIVEKALGAGGMGSVYRCHNKSATRILAAIKVLEGNLRRFPEAEERFIREAEILFSLDHPNIVKVRNVRTDPDCAYIEMEFVEGKSLESSLTKGKVPLHDTLPVMRQLADALAYLHHHGVRHRDIKPANIVITPSGVPKLVDFGLAMETGGERITQQNTSFGTVSYAPPEWISPDKMDPERWDMYALGVVFWEALTGKVAFPMIGEGSARQQAMQVIVAKQNHPPLDPGEEFPDAVRQLVGQLTEPEPTNRPESAAWVAEVLTQLAPPAPIETQASGYYPRPNLTGPSGLSTTTSAVMSPKAPDVPNSQGTLDSEPTGTGSANALAQPDPDAPQSAKALSEGTSASAQAPPAASTAKGPLAVVGVLLIAGLGLVCAVGGLWTSYLLLAPSATREVVLTLPKAAPDASVGVYLGEVAFDHREGQQFHFSGMAPGTYPLHIAYGEGCATCAPGTCADSCFVSTFSTEIPEGDGVFALENLIEPPRQVVLTLTGLDASVPVSLQSQDLKGEHTNDHTWKGLGLPGTHTIEATVGSCKMTHRNCASDQSCPPGCLSLVQTLELPPGAEPFVKDIALDMPTDLAEDPTQAPQKAASPKTTKPKAPTAKPSGQGGLPANLDPSKTPSAEERANNVETYHDDASATGALATVLKKDPSDGVRYAAWLAIEKRYSQGIGSKSATEALVVWVARYRSGIAAEDAASALCKHGASIRSLSSALRAKNPKVRAELVKQCGDWHGDKASKKQALADVYQAQLAGESDEQVKKQLTKQLKKLK